MRTSDEINEVAGALAEAQAVLKPAAKDAVNPAYKSKYADLAAIWEACREALPRFGLAVIQDVTNLDTDVAVTTRITHKSGQWIECGPLMVPMARADAHGLGSAVTYGKRYALSAAVGIASEEDDDGNAASKAAAPRRERFLSDREAPTAEPTTAFDAGLVGFAEIGKGDADFGLRQTTTKLPDGGFRDGWTLAFRLSEKPKGRAGTKVIALDALAEMIAEYRTGIEDQRVTCWGSVSEESFPSAGKTITYSVLNLSRLKVGDLDLSAPEHEPSEEEDATLDELGDLMPPTPLHKPAV